LHENSSQSAFNAGLNLGMDKDDVRCRFMNFCGIERYRKFISAIWTKSVPKQRLIYWQEQIWNEFKRHSQLDSPERFSDICRLFCVCPRHLKPLDEVDAVAKSELSRLLGRVAEDDLFELFPFALIAVSDRNGKVEDLSCGSCSTDLRSRR
jgi:hypothetical protein